MGGKRRKQLRIFLLAAILLPVAGCPRDAVDEKRSHTRLELAKDFLGRRELDAAELEAKKALGHDPRSAEAEYILGLVGMMRAESNLRVLEVDDCLTGVDAEGLRSELDAFLADADGRFARALEHDPEYGEAWANRGAVADLLGDPAAAIGHFERALAHPARLLNVGVVRANLGWAHFHRDDHVRAAKELRQALQFNPTMCLARYRLGRVYFERKEWNKAAEQFQAVVDDKSCPMQEAHLFLVKTQRALGFAEAADQARATCVELATRSCVAAQCRSVP
jgi:Tfp pilus assembly protein PilF